MITAATLKSRTVKDLAAMAKKKGVPGWHVMRKEELIRALLRLAKARASKQAGHSRQNGSSRSSRNGQKKPSTNGCRDAKSQRSNGRNGRAKKVLTPYAERRLKQIKAKLAESKDLAFHAIADGNGHSKDRLVVMVRDPYWLHAYWELGRSGVERARAALGQNWHAARPVLRLLEVTRNGTTSSARKVVREIEIHGGVTNWYVDVQDPPKSYQMEIGYLVGDRFFALAHSNVVTTPRTNGSESFDKNWAEVAKDFDRIYAMSGGYVEQEADAELKEVLEQRLRRPIGEPVTARFGAGAALPGKNVRPFSFRIDTELIVHGVTEPNARVTLKGEPVPLRSDGTFAVRFNLPDRRHVLPMVASSGDGAEQRTIVLAVDRNTKVMEPIVHDASE